MKKESERNAVSPVLSGGDVDAAWDQANVAGEETVGGTVPTPDQDRIDEIGEAIGLVYEDDEPLHGAEKLRYRDENRWELDIESHLPAGREDADPPYLKENHPRMNEKKETLEKQGYQFIINETDSQDSKGTADTYYQVTVNYQGETLGTRSEMSPEDALARALELAELHQIDPAKAEEETLDTPAAD